MNKKNCPLLYTKGMLKISYLNLTIIYSSLVFLWIRLSVLQLHPKKKKGIGLFLPRSSRGLAKHEFFADGVAGNSKFRIIKIFEEEGGKLICYLSSTVDIDKKKPKATVQHYLHLLTKYIERAVLTTSLLQPPGPPLLSPPTTIPQQRKPRRLTEHYYALQCAFKPSPGQTETCLWYRHKSRESCLELQITLRIQLIG